MTEYKCKQCNSNAMRVEKRDLCGKCEFNGFVLNDEIIEEFNMPKQDTFDRYYDEDLRQKASKFLGINIERDEAYEGSCKMGEPMGDGCWLFYCYACNEFVDLTPVASC